MTPQERLRFRLEVRAIFDAPLEQLAARYGLPGPAAMRERRRRSLEAVLRAELRASFLVARPKDFARVLAVHPG